MQQERLGFTDFIIFRSGVRRLIEMRGSGLKPFRETFNDSEAAAV
jgi:hypothetical protein